MSDTWSDIQAVKNRQSSLREKLLRRKKEREGLVAGITDGVIGNGSDSSLQASSSPGASPASTSVNNEAVEVKVEKVKLEPQLLIDLEQKLLVALCDISLNFPVDSTALASTVSKDLDQNIPLSAVQDLLQKFAAQQLICIETEEGNIIVSSADHSTISAVSDEVLESLEPVEKKRKINESGKEEEPPVKLAKTSKQADTSKGKDAVESLLSMQSAKERENKKVNDDILQLLSTPTAKEQSLVEQFKSQGGTTLKEFCQYGTRQECAKTSGSHAPCSKLHFRKIIRAHTDEMLGDCSFLNTCFHMDTCKYVHYEVDSPAFKAPVKKVVDSSAPVKEGSTSLFPAQWVQCDMRNFEMAVLGKFSVVMADPPWDIHMELPYGTMSDDEMRHLQVPSLQDDGYIFLWVTGRAMELGRECLKLWGYQRIDEIIWVKTNQLQRIIRTGRTGHWFNHGKEHCLVGKKGNPKNFNKHLDCDVIVAEVRATSHKPDEIYGIIERLSPGTRKIELFGRPHNVQPNWVTLGNQLDGVKLIEPEVVKAFKEKYPDGIIKT